MTRPSSTPRPRTVFVLSGGGSRGAGQVGMLRALFEAGIVPDVLVGCSVGALNAAFIAADPSLERADQLADRWRVLTTRDVFPGNRLTKFAHLLRRHPYVYPATGVQRMIREWLPGVARLEDLPVQLRVVTTHLWTGLPEYHDTGDLESLLLASAALPAIFPPVYLPDPGAGRLIPHVDGGIADLVPIAGALGLDATRVYILDVTVPPHIERPRSALDVLVHCLMISVRLRATVDFGHQVSVTHIKAPVDVEIGMTDFNNTDRFVSNGYLAAREALAEHPVEVPSGRLRMRRNPFVLLRRYL